MCFKSLLNAKSKIDKNSNNNAVFQNSTVNGPIIVSSSTEDLISILGKTGNYEAIQDIVGKALSQAATIHPLQPDFSAKYNYKINRLVSTPETKEAFKKYPKNIKGTFNIDYKKYPFMSRDETPFEYAYRTQEKVEMETTAYKEYLGDIEDPFPTITYKDGMITVIIPPEFPEPVNAKIVSGDVHVPVVLRRLPCKEYGKTVIGNIAEDPIIDITLTYSAEKHIINIKNSIEGNLETQLIREKLLANLYKTKELSIFVDGVELLRSNLNSTELESDIFKYAPLLAQLIENIIFIQNNIGCVFDDLPDTYKLDDCCMALTLAESLKNNFAREILSFDNSIRIDYDKILPSLIEMREEESIAFEKVNEEVELFGLTFTIDKLIIIYSDAKINNMDSVKRSISKKRNNIMITIKPKDGEKTFSKYYKFEGVKLKQ